jgi:hypothetical protein
MKTIRVLTCISTLVISFLFVTCEKKPVPSAAKSGSGSNNLSNSITARTIQQLVLPENANEELTRIFNDVQNAEDVVAIIANPNYGAYCSNCLYDTYIDGWTEPNNNISITVNNTHIRSRGKRSMDSIKQFHAKFIQL